MSERIERLREAIERSHRCTATHVGSTHIIETFEGKRIWEGVVETFDLVGHPVAKRCYAWCYQDGDTRRFTTILEIPPVDSPHSAVKVAVVAEAKNRLSRPKTDVGD